LPNLDEDSMTSNSVDGRFGLNSLVEDIRLSRVKEKVCRLLYSSYSFRVGDSQRLLHIRQLDGELEDWRLSIPADFRPKLAVSSGSTLFLPTLNALQRRCCIKLQLEYHYLIMAIHTAVRRCGSAYAEGVSIPEDLHSVFHSSLDLALEGSRSTLLLLKNPVVLEQEAFWYV
jgi:hypothetical protein